jgi:hypothetical protein
LVLVLGLGFGEGIGANLGLILILGVIDFGECIEGKFGVDFGCDTFWGLYATNLRLILGEGYLGDVLGTDLGLIWAEFKGNKLQKSLSFILTSISPTHWWV